MYQLRYLKRARADLIEIKTYIAKQSRSNDVANRFMEKLRDQCQKLAELPGTIGRTRPEIMEGLRSFPYGNYIILFRYNGDFLEIVSIIEGHRDIEGLFHP